MDTFEDDDLVSVTVRDEDIAEACVDMSEGAAIGLRMILSDNDVERVEGMKRFQHRINRIFRRFGFLITNETIASLRQNPAFDDLLKAIDDEKPS